MNILILQILDFEVVVKIKLLAVVDNIIHNIGDCAIWCVSTVYPKKYAHGFCFAVLCCGYTLTDFPISIRLTSLALWQSNDCPSASKATLMNMDKYFMWIHYERLHNHNKAKHNKTVCIFLGIYCITPCRGITSEQQRSCYISMPVFNDSLPLISSNKWEYIKKSSSVYYAKQHTVLKLHIY